MFHKKPICLAEIYRALEKEAASEFGSSEENIKDVKVVVKNIDTRDEKEPDFKWALVSCKDCKKDAYLRFRSGSVKNRNPDGSFSFGDMKVGKDYTVSGSAFIDEMGGLVITSPFEAY